MKKNRRINVDQSGRSMETFFVFNGDGLDEEKRLVTGYMDSGEPNNQGYLLDYATTKPYVLKYVAAFEKRTDGISKGAVRVMHQAEVVGKIVDLSLDDESGRILVTVRVDDDAAWKKVLERNYTGFSGHWTIVGQMWEDKAASAKYGRKIFRYTGDPVEVSLVDVPRVPGCEFQQIQNGIMEGEMSEILERLRAVQAKIEAVQNGVGMGNQMASNFEELVWIFKAVQNEEAREGQDQSKAEALRAGLLALKPAIQDYLIAQLDELLPTTNEDDMDEDFDYDQAFSELEAEMPEATFNGITDADLNSIMNGDKPGHPFHGNQHVSSKGVASHGGKAHAATLHANEKGTRGAHARASSAHAKAAAYHKDRGNIKAAKFHEKSSKAHASIASKMNADVESTQNGQLAPTVTNQKDAPMTKEEIESITNGIGAAVALALKPLEEKLDAIKAQPAPVTNGQGVPLPVPQMSGVLVTRDPLPTPPSAVVNGATMAAVIDAIPASQRNPITIADALRVAGLVEA